MKIMTAVMVVLSLVFFGCDSGGGGGKGGGGLVDPAGGGSDPAAGVSPLTDNQKQRVKALMNEQELSNALVFENDLVMGAQKEANILDSPAHSDIAQNINESQCEVTVEGESNRLDDKDYDYSLKIGGDRCMVYGFEKESRKTVKSGNSKSTVTVSDESELEIDGDVDVYKMESSSTSKQVNTMSISANSGSFSMNGSSKGTGTIYSKSEGTVNGTISSTYKGSGTVSPDDGSSKSTVTMKVVYVMNFSDFKMVGELNQETTMVGDVATTETTYKLNGVKVTAEEFEDIFGVDFAADPIDMEGDSGNRAEPRPDLPTGDQYVCFANGAFGNDFMQEQSCANQGRPMSISSVTNGRSISIDITPSSQSMSVRASMGGESQEVQFDMNMGAGGAYIPFSSGEVVSVNCYNSADMVSYYCRN